MIPEELDPADPIDLPPQAACEPRHEGHGGCPEGQVAVHDKAGGQVGPEALREPIEW